MELAKLDIFYGKQAKLYDFTRQFFLFSRKRAIDMLDAKEGELILDFACGTGMNIPYLLESGAIVTGIDYSESMLGQAINKYSSAKFVRGDISKYTFKKKADKAICTYSLTMVDEWERSIENIGRNLKKDGTLVILDFHACHGVGKTIYPLLRWWLRKNGVDPEKKIVDVLNRYFKDVNVHIMNSGYNFIAVAHSPKD